MAYILKHLPCKYEVLSLIPYVLSLCTVCSECKPGDFWHVCENHSYWNCSSLWWACKILHNSVWLLRASVQTMHVKELSLWTPQVCLIPAQCNTSIYRKHRMERKTACTIPSFSGGQSCCVILRGERSSDRGVFNSTLKILKNLATKYYNIIIR